MRMGDFLITAAAGGGSAGFHGGGGGGGHGGGGFWILLWLVAHPVALLIVLIGVACFGFYAWVQSERYKARRRKRVRRVELAAAEASEDDAAFSPDEVRAQATQLFKDVQAAWDANDRVRLRSMVGSDLMVEWQRRLDNFESKGWHNHVQVVSGPSVEYVGMTNRAADSDDRVVVRIEATLRDVVVDKFGMQINHSESAGAVRRLSEYWTLCKRGSDGRWTLLSIEQSSE